MKNKQKLNYPQIFLLGFGFLASSLCWSIYNAQVPLILDNRFLLSSTLIGVIMTIDNFFGVIFQPLVGYWSDKTITAYGRRMPWIAIGLPLCSLLFILIPLQKELKFFMAIIIAFNLIMSLWRSPVIALMPDVTPSPLRSEANGIINLMGGLGAILAFLVGGILSDLREDKLYAFVFASIFMLLSLIMLLLFIREPAAISYRLKKNLPIQNTLANRWAQISRQQIMLQEKDEKIVEKMERTLHQQEKKSLLAMLLAIFFWFMGFNAIESFFTIFASKNYAISGGKASMMLAGFSLAFLLFALPAGKIAKKWGRKKTIQIGLFAIIILFLPILFQVNILLMQILLILGGMSWALININSLPMVLEFSKEASVGRFTGYYYFFSFSAAITSPILYGYLQDFLKTSQYLFAYSLVCFALAFIAMFFVSHGESVDHHVQYIEKSL